MDIYWHLYITGSWITVYPSMFAILKFYIPQMTKFMLSIHTNVQKIKNLLYYKLSQLKITEM